MEWTLASPGIWRGVYEGWEVTKILLHKDVYEVEHYTYLGFFGKLNVTRLTAKSWPKLAELIQKEKQSTLF